MLFPWEGNVPNCRYEYQTVPLPNGDPLRRQLPESSELWSLIQDDAWRPLPKGCWEGTSFEKVALQQIYQKYVDVP